MDETVTRLWRRGAQGIAFATFGLGGGALAVLIFPCVAAFSRDRSLAQKRIRHVIHRSFRFFIWFVQTIGLYAIRVEGREKLAGRRGCLIVANHPTLLDVVILLAQTPNFQCVVKGQLWKNIFLRGVVSAAGFIRNDLSTEEFLDRCVESFAEGYNLVVFPEGTRTVPGQKPKLVRGFANIAMLSHVDIQIVVIRCEPVTLTRDKSWYDVPPTKPCFYINIGDYWQANSYDRTPNRALNARMLTRNLESYYHNVLSNG